MRPLLMIAGILMTGLLLLAGCTILQPREPVPATPVPMIPVPATSMPGKSGSLNVSVSPTLYTPSMSSTVGIGLRATYTGTGSVSYRWETNYGYFLEWDQSTGFKVIEHGAGTTTAIPVMYWSFPPEEGGPVKPSVIITAVAIGPDGRSLAVQHIYVGWQDNVTAVVIPAPCGIQNCHGPVISCGPIPVEICTAEYQLGDRCRAFVACRVVNGSCQAVEFQGYRECAACVAECSNRMVDPAKIFSCESRC